MKKKITILILMAFLLIPFVGATNLLAAESLSVNLNVSTTIEIIPGAGSLLNYLKAEILFVPIKSDNQIIKSFESEGALVGDKVIFSWSKPPSNNIIKPGYSTIVELNNKAPKVERKIFYPVQRGYETEFLERTKNMDYTNPRIEALAKELAEGEDDLFLLVSKVGKWVKNNIKYSLNTITAEAVKPASWVLDQKIGVCDEITTLFIAILRAQGIPAKFVSGVSYTNNPDFPNKWGPHGWAEVYFPGMGWIPFDVTFGEFGWIDIGHIKLKESVDTQEATTRLEWKGSNIKAKIEDLEIKAHAIKIGKQSTPTVSWKLEPAYTTVGFGSYNVLIVDVENNADYYTGIELSLANVKELEIEEAKKDLVLKPKEKKRVFWKFKIKENLKEDYEYDVPLKIYDFREVSETIKIKTTDYDIKFSEQDADNIIEGRKIIENKEIELSCIPEKDKIGIDAKTKINCIIENHFSAQKQADLCLNDDCKKLVLPLKSKIEKSFEYLPEKIGANEIKITLQGEYYRRETTLTVIKLDEASLEVVNIEIPQNLKYGEVFNLEFLIKKKSMSNPQKVNVEVTGSGSNTKIPIGELKESQKIIIDINTKQLLSKKPKFKITINYEDSKGNKKTLERIVGTNVEGVPFWKKIIGWFANLF